MENTKSAQSSYAICSDSAFEFLKSSAVAGTRSRDVPSSFYEEGERFGLSVIWSVYIYMTGALIYERLRHRRYPHNPQKKMWYCNLQDFIEAHIVLFLGRASLSLYLTLIVSR
jgi:hypothetical protein